MSLFFSKACFLVMGLRSTDVNLLMDYVEVTCYNDGLTVILLQLCYICVEINVPRVKAVV